ncbi:MAG: DUF1987 domain-containing protein [Bacteroidia bacterium]|nr:DUF1987 domain-containing protein [Bacteroidia bacterium]
MEPISIQGTQKTPTINFNNLTGKIEITGRSMAEDSIKFYKPLLDWLEQYITNPHTPTEIMIQLEYFNTSSSKCLLDIFKKIETLHKTGIEVIINWYYEEENEVLLDAGQDYQTIIKVPFNMIKIDE